MSALTSNLGLILDADATKPWGADVRYNWNLLDAFAGSLPPDFGKLNYVTARRAKASPYNAVGDGVADDTLKIIAAISAADGDPNGGNVVYLDPGDYKISDMLKLGVALVNHNVSLVGAGALSSRLIVTGAPADSALISTRNNKFFHIQDIGIVNSSSTSPGGLFIVGNAERVHLTRVRVDGFDIGVLLGDSGTGAPLSQSVFDTLFVLNATVGVLVSQQDSRDLHFRNLCLDSCATGLKAYDSGGIHIDGATVFNSTVTAFDFRVPTSRISIRKALVSNCNRFLRFGSNGSAGIAQALIDSCTALPSTNGDQALIELGVPLGPWNVTILSSIIRGDILTSGAIGSLTLIGNSLYKTVGTIFKPVGDSKLQFSHLGNVELDVAGAFSGFLPDTVGFLSAAVGDPAAAGQVFTKIQQWDHGLTTGLTRVHSDIEEQGEATFASAATVLVTFLNPQKDTNYTVVISGAENETFWRTAKTVNGFTLHSSNATSLTTIDWQIRRFA